MKNSGISYKKFKNDYQELNPRKKNILLKQDTDPRFVKPMSLLDYENQEEFKLFGDKKDSIKPEGGLTGSGGATPQKQTQPKPSLNEIIAERKRKEQRRFVINSPEERNRPVAELFKIVGEAKKTLEDGSQTLNECYQIMLGLQVSVSEQNKQIHKMYKVAEDLLYDAKCQVAIGDEDPKDANPQFSMKAFKQHIKMKQLQQQELNGLKNSEISMPSVSKSKRKKELGGVKVERDTNKSEYEADRMMTDLPRYERSEDSSDSATKKEQEKIIQDWKYQKFKERQQEFDTHCFFISKQNQLVKPSYVFQRKNHYLEYINNTAKKIQAHTSQRFKNSLI